MKKRNVSANRMFKILDYEFAITDQLNTYLDLKYCIEIYDEEKRYFRTIGYCNTIQEGKENALKYLASNL